MVFAPDEMPKKKQNTEFPRVLDEISVHELKEYIAEMKIEIERVEKDIKKKEASKSMADDVFG